MTNCNIKHPVKNSIALEKRITNSNTSEHAEKYQDKLLKLKRPFDLNKLKEKYKNYSTSTFLNNKDSKFYFKPEDHGFFGLYGIVNEYADFEVIGCLTVFNNETPWNYDNNTDRFIEIYAIKKGIVVFDSIEVGKNFQILINQLGEPTLKLNDYFIYYDKSQTIAIFKIVNKEIVWFKIGKYNSFILNNFNENIKYLLE
jgi:hypothetical protein